MKKISDLLYSQSGSEAVHRERRWQKSFYDKESIAFLALVRNWPDIIGEKLAGHTQIQKLTHQTLTISVSHSAYAQQLSFLHDQIISKIIQRYPALSHSLTNLKFINRPIQKISHEPKESSPLASHQQNFKNKFNKEYQKQIKDIQEELKDLKDDDIKDLIASIIYQHRHQ